MPDADRFQIIRHTTSKYKRMTFIMQQGEKSADGKFRVDGYIQRSATNKLGIKVEVSELSITFLPDGRTLKLGRRVKQIIPTYFAQFKLGQGEDFYVKKGDSFRIPSDPKTEYKLIDVKEDSVVISVKSKRGKGEEVEVEIKMRE